MHRTPITVEGFESVCAELEELKKKRIKISGDIHKAREHGDLSENAEYHYAREQQGLVESKIRGFEHIISTAQVIDVKKIPYTGRVVFGATVSIVKINGKRKKEICKYQIVGECESNLEYLKISVFSPMARAMISKQVGEIFEISIPNVSDKENSSSKYKIIKIEH